MKLTEIIKKNILAVVALVTVIGFSSFKILKDNDSQSNLVFRYNPPSSNPYSSTNVKDTDNWELDETSTQCPTTQNQVACSIVVPSGNTMNGEQELDPSKVIIETQQFSTNNHRVIGGTGYTSPVNKTLP